MKWYKPILDSDLYDRLTLFDRNDMKFYLEFHTQYYRHRIDVEWKELEVKVSSLNNPGDFYSFVGGGTLALTKKAYIVMEDLISESVDILILREKEKQYFFLKILDFVDCLDYELSKYHVRTAEMIGVESYAFKEKLMFGKHIFFLPRAHHVVVSQDFKNRVEKFELKGLIFRELC